MDVLERLRARITARQPRDLPPHAHRRAAVLIPVFRAGEVPTVLLTRRTETVERHKGQISFPGGGEEPDDTDLQATALRETYEEIGLAPDQVAIWGRLDEVETVVSGFAITPYVGLIPWPVPLRPNPNEIAEILTVPLAVFLDPKNLRIEKVTREGRPYDLLFYDYPPHVIWGVTARIIHGMVGILQGDAQPGRAS
ncbi:MAG: CoA pyrophosphatase [Armatimonadota bacterium]|nr:CoA pyrophosphatase [Armatimonadota bacterium]